MIKLMFCLRRRPDLDRAAFQTYWRETHAPLVAARAEALGVRRYVQSHTVDAPGLHGALQARNGGAPEPFDGVAELWFDDLEAIGGTEAGAVQAAAELLEDERNFIDLARSPIFVVSEHRVHPSMDPGAAPIIGCRDVDATIEILERIGFACPEGSRFGQPGEGTVYATLDFEGMPVHLQIRRRDLFPSDRESIESDAYLFVRDVDGVHARCVTSGITILRDLQGEPYGLRDFTIELPEGQRIAFGTPIG